MENPAPEQKDRIPYGIIITAMPFVLLGVVTVFLSTAANSQENAYLINQIIQWLLGLVTILSLLTFLFGLILRIIGKKQTGMQLIRYGLLNIFLLTLVYAIVWSR
jgi:polyferredoxin